MHGILAGASPRTVLRDPVLPGTPGRRRRRYSRAQLLRGIDGQGRFIGPFDVDRGLRFFWNASHRRGAAPIVHGFDFGAGIPGTGGRGGLGVPKPSHSGLTPANLREIWALSEAHTPIAAIARQFGVTYATIKYHLGPSVGMRCALAQRSSD